MADVPDIQASLENADEIAKLTGRSKSEVIADLLDEQLKLEKSALEKLNMKKADISDKMNTSQIKEYIRRAKSGQDVNEYLKQFNLKKIELDQLTALMQKRT